MDSWAKAVGSNDDNIANIEIMDQLKAIPNFHWMQGRMFTLI